MKFIRLGKRQGLTYQTCQTLPQGVIPAFHVYRPTRLLAHTLICILCEGYCTIPEEVAQRYMEVAARRMHKAETG